MRRSGYGACLAAALLSWACNNNAAPPEAPPPPSDEVEPAEVSGEAEALETGKDCATAEAVCENGICTATVKNSCDGPVTCELSMYAMCKGDTEAGEARGKGRGTIAGSDSGDIQAQANCEGRAVALTQADGLSCR
jgi:hypothetical protein